MMCLSFNKLYYKYILRKKTLENTEQFTFSKIKYGKVIKVYDGDTITIATKFNGKISSFVVRLSGIDTPEIKTKNAKEKQLAIKARDGLKDLIFHKIIRLDNIQNEKYGRILADIYIDNIHINRWMIESNYADDYDGGKKNRTFIDS